MAAALSDPLTLPCGAVLRNRIMKSAMTEGLADPQDQPTERHARLYERWSRGGAGLLMTGNVMIDRRHLERVGNVVMDEAVNRDALRAWAKAGACAGNQLWMQLSQPGRQCPKSVNPHPVSASDVQLHLGGQFARPRPLREEEIEALIGAFARAAVIARETGFTGVQIHGAHGYLINQFLSPLTNRRDDQWGGSLQNRARVLRRVVRAVRAGVGGDFPISVKLNSADFQKGGFTLDECIQVVSWLGEEGIDLLEISGGTYEQPRLAGLVGSSKTFEMPKRESTLRREAFFLRYAEAIHASASMPLAITGGFRSRATMQEALASGDVEVIGLARPFCADPETPNKLLEGRIDQVETRQESLRLGPWLLGLNSPAPMLRAMNMMAQMGWCYEQIVNMAEGRALNPDIGPWRALRDTFRRDKAVGKARQPMAG